MKLYSLVAISLLLAALSGADAVCQELAICGNDLLQVRKSAPSKQPASKPTNQDFVSAIAGDSIHGHVACITPDGLVSITADHFAGPVHMRLANISQITLVQEPPKDTTALDRVILTNKDVIAGKVIAISPKAITIKSAEVGEFTIQRSVVKSIHFANSSASDIISQFQYGVIRPWKVTSGKWHVKNKKLTINGKAGNVHTVAAPWDYARSFTMTIDVEGRRNTGCQLVLFTTNEKASNRQSNVNGVNLRIVSHYYSASTRLNGRHQQLGHANLGMGFRGGNWQAVERNVYTVSFDTETRAMKIWKGNKLMGRFLIPEHFVQGKYVVLNGYSNVKMSKLDVRAGVHEPGGEKPTATEGHQILFKNHDRVEAASLIMEKGSNELAVNLAFGEVSIAKEALVLIDFGTKGQELPRRIKGDVLVETLRGRYTLQLEALTDKALLGKANVLGGIQINRSSIRRIQFNPYQ
jgi:hypothetical protein